MHSCCIFPPKCLNLIKPAIVCSENKVLPKNFVLTDLVCQSQYRGQHRSLDDIIFAIHRQKEKVVIGIKCEYCILHACFTLCVKIIAFCIKNAFK